MKPKIKFGDILKYSDGWFTASGASESRRAKRFVATGRITGKAPDYLVSVAGENSSYVQTYHYTFLEKVSGNSESKAQV